MYRELLSLDIRNATSSDWLWTFDGATKAWLAMWDIMEAQNMTTCILLPLYLIVYIFDMNNYLANWGSKYKVTNGMGDLFYVPKQYLYIRDCMGHSVATL
jgi:hypothetical protein